MPSTPTPKSEWGRWAYDTLERGARAYASSWVAIYAGQAIIGFDASFTDSLKAAAFGTFVSVMFSIAGKTQGAPDSASFLPAKTDPPQPQP